MLILLRTSERGAAIDESATKGKTPVEVRRP